MRSDYLYKVATATAAANGVATVILKPDVGQYWNLRYARVSIPNQGAVSTTGPYSNSQAETYCELFLGNTSVTTTNGVLIDSTRRGLGDTSGLISGTVLQFGDTIVAEWINASPGDTCMLEIVGMSSDTPPSLGDSAPLLNSIPFRHQIRLDYSPVTNVDIQNINFVNPGQSNNAVIINPALFGPQTQIYIMSMQWVWNPATSNAGDGMFQDGSGTLISDQAGTVYPRVAEFCSGFSNGYALNGNLLQWHQTNTAVAGTGRCLGSITLYARAPL